jgi:hypothetical protein
MVEKNRTFLPDKKATLRISRIKLFVLVQTFQDLRIIGQFKNLPLNGWPRIAENRPWIFAEVIQPSAHPAAPYRSQTPNGRSNLCRCKFRQERSVGEKIAIH